MKVVFERDVVAKSGNLSLAYLAFRSAASAPSPAALLEEMQRLETRLRSNPIRDRSLVDSYRKLWWKFDVDPTKLRPSAEALQHRVLAGKSLPHILNLVDVCNLVSLESQLSTGLHDLDLLQGQRIVVRRCRAGETFQPIGSKGQLTLLGKEFGVSDEVGLIDLMYSTSSGERTKVTGSTHSFVFCVYAPEQVSQSMLRDALTSARNLYEKYCNAQMAEEGFTSAL